MDTAACSLAVRGASRGTDWRRDGPTLRCQPCPACSGGSKRWKGASSSCFQRFCSFRCEWSFSRTCCCPAVAASDHESANRREVLALFLTLGETILIWTTFGVRFRKKSKKHLPQQEMSPINWGRFWLLWGAIEDPCYQLLSWQFLAFVFPAL